MRSTQQMSITLPLAMAQVVKTKVASGEYATESEVLRDGLRSLMARDKAVEAWLQQTAGPSLDAHRANPSLALTGDEVRANLKKAQRPRKIA